MFTSQCSRCKKVFDRDSKGQPFKSQGRADQAVAMHKGRVHSRIIPTYMGGRIKRRDLVAVGSNGFKGLDLAPSNVAQSFENPTARVERRGRKGKLTHEQSDALVNFIRTRRNDFTTKTACFSAALEEVGVARIIRNNSVAVSRYFAKAEGKPSEYQKRISRRNGKNNMALMRVEQPAQLVVTHEHGVLMKRCPSCGLVIEGAEDILQLLQDSPEIVQLALAAARKMHARKLQQMTPP